MTRRALVVVDYQVDFVDGPLGGDDAVSIGPAIRSAIVDALQAGDTVIFTMDTHDEGYLSTFEGRNLPVEHCIRGTVGWSIHPSLTDLVGDNTVLEKDTFGCHQLLDLLKGFDEVEVCGVATNVCVLANAVIARTACPDARILVRRDHVASYDRELGDLALSVMPSLQIDVV